MSVPLIEVVDLHAYYGQSHVLRGVSLALGDGEALALVGRNGMGKTTLLHSILGLVPRRRGEVRIGGVSVTALPPHRIARSGIGLVPEGRRVFPNLSVRENLVLAQRPGPSGAAPWTLESVLALFPRLAERLAHRGSDISGGEQQMVSIGRALLANPRALLLDEATEGLAPSIRAEIWSVIRRLKHSGVAVLAVDKDLDALASACERCLLLAKGEIVFAGSWDALAARPDLLSRYLGV